MTLNSKYMPSISSAIRQIRQRWLDDGKVESFAEINQGPCENFAEDVIALLGFAPFCDAGFYTVSNDDFRIDGDAFDCDYAWDWSKVDSTSTNLTRDELSSFDFSYHVWITDGNKHYDAECPDGVDNFFELPLFLEDLDRNSAVKYQIPISFLRVKT